MSPRPLVWHAACHLHFSVDHYWDLGSLISLTHFVQEYTPAGDSSSVVLRWSRCRCWWWCCSAGSTVALRRDVLLLLEPMPGAARGMYFLWC